MAYRCWYHNRSQVTKIAIRGFRAVPSPPPISSIWSLPSMRHKDLFFPIERRGNIFPQDNQGFGKQTSLWRRIVTWSAGPSMEPNVNNEFLERPEAIVLAESALHVNHLNVFPDHDGKVCSQSWQEQFASFYPRRGLHFSSVDMMASNDDVNANNAWDPPTLPSLESNLREDLSKLDGDPFATSSSAHVVLVARGPIPCLIAQYFLESLPLAGLVLVDPLLLPENERAHAASQKPTVAISHASNENILPGRWESSLKNLMDMLHPTENDLSSESLRKEMSLLQSLANSKNSPKSPQENISSFSPRPLRLEPASAPMLVFYSSDHPNNTHQDHYRLCAERTAAFHTCHAGLNDNLHGGSGDYFDQVAVMKIPTLGNDGGTADIQWLMERIYEWYDEVVA